MKKIVLFIFLLIILSGCSTGNLVDKNNKNNRSVTETRLNFNVNPGDKIGNFTVLSVQNDNLPEPEFCGQTSFVGEHSLTGHFVYTPDAPIPLSFRPSIDSSIPRLIMSDKNKTVFLALGFSDVSIFQEPSDLNFQKITSAIPEFQNFINDNAKNSKGAVFNQELTIKVRNLFSNLCTTRDSGTSALLVYVAKDGLISNTNKECTKGVINFNYPSSWGNCQLSPDGKILFRTDYPQYQVDLQLTLFKSDKERYDKLKGTALHVLELNRDSGEFYDYPQGGALAAGMLNINGLYYDYNFEIVSNQPIPSNLDGVWLPDSNIQEGALLEIIRSAKVVK